MKCTCLFQENASKQELLLNQHSQFLSMVQDGEKWLLHMSRKLNSLTKKSVDNLDQDEDAADSTEEIKQQLEKIQVSSRMNEFKQRI